MNEYLVSKIFNLCVVKLSNSPLLLAFHALILIILNHNLIRSDLIRGSLTILGNHTRTGNLAAFRDCFNGFFVE